MTTPDETSPRVPASWWRSIGPVPGALVAPLPKAACPLCVAAYAGAVSSLGLGFLLTGGVDAGHRRLANPECRERCLGLVTTPACWTGHRLRRRSSDGRDRENLVEHARTDSHRGRAARGRIDLDALATAFGNGASRSSEVGSKPKERTHMAKRMVEIFSAGCLCCEEAIQLVRSMTCDSCDLQILDMRSDKAAQAKQYGVRRVPAVVVNGRLAECCQGTVGAETRRELGVGTPA